MLLKFSGVIDNETLLKNVLDLHKRLFNEPAETSARKRAEHIEFYIGPRFVENGTFVPPKEFNFSKEHLAAFAGKQFPNEGCRIERLFFPDGTFAVLLVDASDPVNESKALNCIYAAILTGLGEDLHGRRVVATEENLRHIEQIVADLRK